MTGQRYFAILAAMRTGSNLLEKTLEALGDTDCHGEAFNPAFISRPGAKEVLGHTVGRRDADPLGFLETLIHARPDRIAGFRIFPGHSRLATKRILADPRCTRIVLTRDPLESWISLQIAQQTGQWMLRDPKRRRRAKIRFDAAEFEAYVAQRMAHLGWIETRLAKHGTTAIRVDYRELSDRARLQEIAHAIGSHGTVPADPPILRQNPEALADKVENHAEMCAYLGLEPEPPTPAPQTDAPSILRPEGFPVGCVPVPGPAFAPAVALLHRIEVRDFRREKLPLPDLIARAMAGTLYPAAPRDSSAFAVVCHPLARAHAAFVHECFGPGWRASNLRRVLVRNHGTMPRRRDLARQTEPYPDALYRAHFNGFLDAIADAMAGSGPYPLIAEWIPQSDLLDQHGIGPHTVRVFHQEDFPDAALWLTRQVGVPQLRPGQISGIRKTGQQSLLPTSTIAVPTILDRVRQLYAADFERFGYAEYSTGNSGASNCAPST